MDDELFCGSSIFSGPFMIENRFIVGQEYMRKKLSRIIRNYFKILIID